MTSRLLKLPTPVFFILYALMLGIYTLWLGNQLPCHNDIFAYVYPERTFNLMNLSNGFIPLWNPLIAGGIPHLANWQSACFYPFFWLFNLTGIPHGLVWLALFHQGWACIGFFLWIRSQGLSKNLAVLGALSFSGSAHFIHCWANIPFVAAASWIPWVFWAFEKHLQKPEFKTISAAILCLSLQIFAGYPIFVVYTWITLAGWLLWKRPHASQWLSLFLIALCSLLVTTAQWLPFSEFLTFSNHGGWTVFPYYIHPVELLTLFHPTLLGIPFTNHYQSDSTNSIFGNLYFGLIPAVLWLAGFIVKRTRGLFWNPVSLLLLAWMTIPALSFGQNIPQKIFDLLEPSKAISLFLFGACTSACLLADQISIGSLGSKPIWKWFFILAILDILILPFRLTYRVSDPYPLSAQSPLIQSIRQNINGGRIFATQPNSLLQIQSDKIDDIYQSRLAELFVDNLFPNTNMVWAFPSTGSYLSLRTDNSVNMG